MRTDLGVTLPKRGPDKPRKLAKSLGLVVEEHSTATLPPDTHQYAPPVMHILDDKWRDSNVLHECAHWLVASPTRRKLPNYGQWEGVDEYWPEEEPPDATFKRTYHEELMASSLGIALLSALGLPWLDTYALHGWGPGEGFDDYLGRAISRVAKWQ